MSPPHLGGRPPFPGGKGSPCATARPVLTAHRRAAYHRPHSGSNVRIAGSGSLPSRGTALADQGLRSVSHGRLCRGANGAAHERLSYDGRQAEAYHVELHGRRGRPASWPPVVGLTIPGVSHAPARAALDVPVSPAPFARPVRPCVPPAGLLARDRTRDPWRALSATRPSARIGVERTRRSSWAGGCAIADVVSGSFRSSAKGEAVLSAD